jgi:hypothetical protein
MSSGIEISNIVEMTVKIRAVVTAPPPFWEKMLTTVNVATVTSARKLLSQLVAMETLRICMIHVMSATTSVSRMSTAFTVT